MQIKYLLVSICILFSASCDWVDSTGVSESSPPPLLLEEGLVTALTEGQRSLLDPGEVFRNAEKLLWQAVPLQEGKLPGCATVDDFYPEFAAQSLKEACSKAVQCEVYFEESTATDENGTYTVFNLTPPVLRAPIGLTYQLTATDQNGVNSQANFTFCLRARNDPPVATNDVFSVQEQTSLVISPTDINLLSNDMDDVDARNDPLRVITPASNEPSLASGFQLFVDGGFNYTPDPTMVLQPGETRTDGFEYQITDGLYTETASVLINISAEDKAPILVQDLPDELAIVGISKSISLSEYFRDPEGGQLGYSVNIANLPLSGNFTLSETGVLSGIAQPEDVGNWTIFVGVRDVSGMTAESSFNLNIVDNLPPESSPISVQSTDIAELFALDTSIYFSDPENMALSYTLTGMTDSSVTIDRVSGKISGFFAAPGDYKLTVTVSDGVNLPVSEAFAVEVISQPNRAPIYSGTITNKIALLGQVMLDVQGKFNDLDGDVLSYAVLGRLPVGVTLAASTGIISGTPTQLGIYAGIRIVASDPAGKSATSDTFSITVTPPRPNRIPNYSGTIDNQTITLGSAIAVIEGRFVDLDDDPLSYSVVGVRPAGLALSVDGVLTGRPLDIGTSVNLRIRATDPGGLSALTDIFRISVTAAPPTTNNRKPEYVGSLVDQDAVLGQPITAIKGNFTDPDNNELSYTLRGRLPAGVVLNRATGSISGTPRSRGNFTGLVLVASDPGKLFALSDRFSIVVE